MQRNLEPGQKLWANSPLTLRSESDAAFHKRKEVAGRCSYLQSPHRPKCNIKHTTSKDSCRLPACIPQHASPGCVERHNLSTTLCNWVIGSLYPFSPTPRIIWFCHVALFYTALHIPQSLMDDLSLQDGQHPSVHSHQACQ